MNNKRTLLLGSLLAGGICAAAWAQQTAPAQNQQNPAAQPANANQSAQQTDSSTDQPMSLAEAARMARASKPASEKAARKYDDDNFPRSAPLVQKKPSQSGVVSAPVQGLPEEMKGKIVLLDFWASWCGPCRAGVPNVQRLNGIYSSEDFMVISVSEDEDEPTWRNYVSSHQMTWTQRFDADDSLSHRFQVAALPTYVLLDRDGNEIHRWVGEDPGRSILERIGPEIKRRLQASY